MRINGLGGEKIFAKREVMGADLPYLRRAGQVDEAVFS